MRFTCIFQAINEPYLGAFVKAARSIEQLNFEFGKTYEDVKSNMQKEFIGNGTMICELVNR